MRRAGSALAALLGLLLTSCAITPPVLGGPFPDGDDPRTPGARWTDEGVAALLILNDPESPLGESSVADYRTESLAAAPDLDPASCRDGFVSLVLFARDEQVDGTVFRPPILFRDAPGADLLVTQVARRFDTADEAAAFLDDLRTARAVCAEFATADGSVGQQEVVDGDFAVRSAGFAVTVTSSDGASTTTFEWVLVESNVAISLRAELLDDDASSTLAELAEEYADRLTE